VVPYCADLQTFQAAFLDFLRRVGPDHIRCHPMMLTFGLLRHSNTSLSRLNTLSS
jgi:hypothetical protein